MSVDPQSWLEAAGTAGTLLAGLAMRWLSRAGRLVRRQRAENEDALEVLYRTRQLALEYGAPRRALPRTASERRAAIDPGADEDDEAQV